MSMSEETSAAAPIEGAPQLHHREIILTSSDGEDFKVSASVISISKLVSDMIGDEHGADDEHSEDVIPLPNVKGADLAKVIEYCAQYSIEPMTELQKPLQDTDLGILVQPWYADFIDSKSNDEIFHLTLAANYLDIRPLLDLCCAKVASYIKGKTPEEIRKNLNIEVDFTPEEEAQIRTENAWADDLT